MGKDERILCVCGCGRKPVKGEKYAKGYKKKELERLGKPLCACGCGERVKNCGARFISGHNTQLNPPMKNPETVKKNIASRDCKGKEISTCKHPSCSNPVENYTGSKNKTKYCSRKCANSDRCSNMHPEDCKCTSCKSQRGEYFGENSPNWRGGLSFGSYTKTFKETRKIILERDDYKCSLCSRTKEESVNQMDLSVHHIDYNKQNDNLSNLITLCLTCHLKTNSNREYWTCFFREEYSEILSKELVYV